MATSNSVDLTATGADIINEALELCGVLEDGGSASTTENSSAQRTLNYMCKAWQQRGTHLYKLKKAYLFVEKDISVYTVNTGATGAEHYTEEDPWANHTTLATAAAASDPTITLTAASTAADSDVILFKLSDGNLHQDTISSGGGTTTITLGTGLPSTSGAANGTTVYWYTAKAAMPKTIDLAAWVTKPESTQLAASETPIEIVTRKEFFELNTKGTDGRPSILFYDASRSTGQIHLWPQPDDVEGYVKFWVERKIQDFDAVGGTDNADYPSEWFMALSLGLAVNLCPKYGVPKDMFNEIYQLYQEARFDAESGETEHEMFIQPDVRWTGR